MVMNEKVIHFGTHTRFLPCLCSYPLMTRFPFCADCTAHHRTDLTGSHLVDLVEQQAIPTLLDGGCCATDTHKLGNRFPKPKTPPDLPNLIT